MNKKNKVGHLTSVHGRFDTRIFYKECESLHSLGYDVSLIVADGLGDTVVNGIKIFDVGKPKNRFNRIFITTFKILKKARELDCHIYHFHDPELIFCGLKLQKKHKVIFDIHEDFFLQIKLKKWLPFFVREIIANLYKKIEKYAISKIDAIIVPQPIMLDLYLKLKKNSFLIENFVILNTSFNKTDYTNKIHFHAGGLTEDRGLDNMLSTFDKLSDEYTLLLAGGLNEEKAKEIKEEYDNVSYIGKISHEDVLKKYEKCTVGLILYNNVGQYYLSYSIKLFEYMMYGIPVIMPNFGEWIEFNKVNKCGINVDVTNHIVVAETIKQINNNIALKQNLGTNGRKAVLEKYNWSICEKKLKKIYSNLASD